MQRFRPACRPNIQRFLSAVTIGAAGVLTPRPGLAMPSWAKQGGQRLNGSIYEVICSGRGPDIDLARSEAMRACSLFAAREVPGSVQVRSLTVESERSVGFHEELSENLTLTGLICRPQREEVEESRGELTLWLQCEFDLSKARVTDKGASEESAEAVADRESPRSPSRPTARSGRRLIAMTTVPTCDTILVRGAHPRVVECDGDPVTLVIGPEDRQLIVRARDYQPESLNLSRLRLATGGSKANVVQVLLSPL